MPSKSLSVKVIVHDRHGNVLLLRRSPASRHNAGKWEFPGGKIEALRFDQLQSHPSDVVSQVFDFDYFGLVVKLGL